MNLERLRAMGPESAQKLVAVFLVLTAVLKLSQFVLFRSVGLFESGSFYTVHAVLALALAVGVYRGHRLAGMLAALLYALLAYKLISTSIDLEWSFLLANGLGVLILISLFLTLLLYTAIIVSFFWLERLRINTPSK